MTYKLYPSGCGDYHKPMNQKQYKLSLKAMASQKKRQYLMVTKDGPVVIGLLKKVFQVIKGFFGFTNRTNEKRVDAELLKFFYYGETHGYLNDDEIGKLIREVRNHYSKEKSPVSKSVQQALTTLSDIHSDNPIKGRKESLKEMRANIVSYHQSNRKAIRPGIWRRVFCWPKIRNQEIRAFGDGYLEMAKIASKGEKYSEALTLLEDAWKTECKDAAFINRLTSYTANFVNDLDNKKRLGKLKERSCDLLLNLAKDCMDVGCYSVSPVALETVERLKGADNEVSTLLGICYVRGRKRFIAQHYLDKVVAYIEAEKDNPTSRDSIYRPLSWVYENQRNWKLARKYMKKAMSVNGLTSDKKTLARYCFNGAVQLMDALPKTIEEFNKVIALYEEALENGSRLADKPLWEVRVKLGNFVNQNSMSKRNLAGVPLCDEAKKYYQNAYNAIPSGYLDYSQHLLFQQMSIYMAGIFIHEGNMSAAENCMLRLVQLHPGYRHGKSLLGQIYLLKSEYKLATPFLKQVEASLNTKTGAFALVIEGDNPQDLKAYKAELWCHISRIYSKNNHFKKAIQAVKKAVHLQPENKNFQTLLSKIYSDYAMWQMYSQQDMVVGTQQAISYFEKAIANDPAEATYKVQLAKAYLYIGNHTYQQNIGVTGSLKKLFGRSELSKAIECFEKAYQLAPEMEGEHLKPLLQHYQDKLDYPKAIALYEQHYELGYLAINPELYWQMGQNLQINGKEVEALNCFEKAYKIKPSEFKYQDKCALLAWELAKKTTFSLPKRLNYYEKAYDYASNILDASKAAEQIALICRTFANTYLKKCEVPLEDYSGRFAKEWEIHKKDHEKDLQMALQCYDRALKRHPNCAEVHFEKGLFIEFFDIEPDTSLECFRKAVQYAGNNTFYRLRLANKYRELGSEEKYEEHLSRSGANGLVRTYYEWYEELFIKGSAFNHDPHSFVRQP